MKFQPLDVLKSAPSVQERIDMVAADLNKKRSRFSKVEVSELADILGVDFHDHADCPKRYFNYKSSLEHAGYEFPLCEQIDLLEGFVSPERYKGLVKLANEIILDDQGLKHDSWLALSAEEEQIIHDEYAQENSTASALEVAQFCLKATDGSELIFEVTIGDGGEVSDPLGPYDFKKGKEQGLSDFYEVDNY